MMRFIKRGVLSALIGVFVNIALVGWYVIMGVIWHVVNALLGINLQWQSTDAYTRFFPIHQFNNIVTVSNGLPFLATTWCFLCAWTFYEINKYE